MTDLLNQMIEKATGFYGDIQYAGGVANPESVIRVYEEKQKYSLAEREVLILLSRSAKNELELVLEPNPIALVNALQVAKMELHGVMVFEGDDFEFFGTTQPFTHTAKKQSQVLSGVAIHARDLLTKTDLYRFISAEHLQSANDYFIHHALGGVIPSIGVQRALMFSVAIRNTIKWLMPQYFDRDFSRYQVLTDFHMENLKSESNSEVESPRSFRRVQKNAISLTAQMLGESKNDPLIVFEKLAPVEMSDDDFLNY